MKRCLQLIFLLMVIKPVHAQWIAIDSAAKQGETHYFDPQTLQKNGQFRKVWILSSYDEKQKGGYLAVKSLYEFDCSLGKARSIALLLYPDKKAFDAVIGAHHAESQDWFGFTPNSIFQHLSKTICTD